MTDSLVTSDPIKHPAPGSAAYHRLGRTSPSYRWWKPLLVGLLGTVFYLVALVLLFLGAVLAGLVVPEVGRSLNTVFTDSLAFDLTDPVTLAVVLLSLIPLLPALLLATRIVGAQRVGLLSSVAGRLRWRWMLRCASVAAAVYLVGYLVIFAVSALGGESVAPDLGRPELPVLLILTVLLVPLQSAAEEYVFRGYLMQTIGGWLRHPAFAILLPIPLFVIGHDYELIGMIDVAVFAAAAGWLTWRTGGLEAAIALHVVNNLSIFGLSAIGLVDPNGTDLGPVDLVFSLLMTLTFVVVVTRLQAHPARGAEARYGRGDTTL
ncbi:CPBP family intramembrane metalloprotease [Cryobacterium sp. 1639]|uniref:CPBP family intramembrane glutamic endopeptidase n=1 Tax=Cryobacterium inferilacus TaxID=2866629 RepID=UPI001C731107|nr:CPBP family intramembrane glutamic endopeptidase [Cryobacterium sp. 1639]MBX0299152.1 CPBP family intramembrane metalloprotease [Cryobacterium sp. 1639]